MDRRLYYMYHPVVSFAQGGVVMNREFWLDGFNFFHHWEKTRDLLRPDSGFDIVKAMARALGMLGRQLGTKCGQTVVFMDGGLSRHETMRGRLRVRYCGPGGKADDRMARDLEELGPDARLVTAVSNDRELKDRMRLFGAACLGVGEFLAVLEGNKPRGKGSGKKGGGKANASRPGHSTAETADVMREKTKSLSPSEVKAWMEFFGFEDGE